MSVTETRVRITADNKTKQAFKRVQGDIKKTSGATKELRKATVALAGSYAALRVAGKVVDVWRNFGAAISDLSAITGATGRDLDFLRQKSLEFGETTTLSASQAAEAFKLVASAKPDLLDNRDALAAVTKEAITLAEASDSTLPDAARTLGVALNQYGAGAEEASRFINVLAAGSQKGASEIAKTAEAIKVAGLVAAGTGTSFEEMNAAIQVMSTVALKGSEAGTGLRNIYLNLANQSNAQFKPSVVGLTTAIENLQKAQLDDIALLKIFDKTNIVAAKALINKSDALSKMRENLTGTTTAYEQASIKVDNLNGDMKKLGSVWESVALLLGETLDPALRAIVQSLSWLAKVAKSIILEFKDMGDAIGAFAAQAVAAASLDFAAVANIGKERTKNAAALLKEKQLIWDNTVATQQQAAATSGNTEALKERVRAAKELARKESAARQAVLTEENAKIREAEALAQRTKSVNDLFALEEKLMTEEQRIMASHERRSFMVEDAFQQGLINDERRNELILQLDAQQEAARTDIIQRAADERRNIASRSLGAIAGIFDGLGALMSKSGKKQTAATRALARASIIASTAQAVMNALAVSPYPLGVSLAIGAALKGAAQLRAVGGSGGAATSGISGTAGSGSYTGISPPPNVSNTTNETRTTSTTVNIYGAITQDMIRDDVIPVLQTELNEHDLQLFDETSRQASVEQ